MTSENRKIKDTVFTSLFRDPENLIKLYSSLFPDEKPIRREDIENLTIENVLTKGIYNDLGFVVGNRLLVLVEAQTLWSPNIAIRFLFYFAETLKRYLESRDEDVHSSRLIHLPEPVFILVYTGDRKRGTDVLSFNENHVGSTRPAFEMQIRVVRPENARGILKEYIEFCSILNAQRIIFRERKEALEAAIDLSIQNNILKNFLNHHKGEVISMLDYLFDQEAATERYGKTMFKEGKEEGIKEGINRMKQVSSLWKKGLSPEEIASELNLSLEDVYDIVSILL